jgi:hypothetical protein
MKLVADGAGSEHGYGLKSEIQGAMVHQECAEYESKHSYWNLITWYEGIVDSSTRLHMGSMYAVTTGTSQLKQHYV